MSRFDHIKTREQMERPVSEGGMSMGAGRVVDSFHDCPGAPDYPPSPDGKHHYVAISNVQSVEHFSCRHCEDEYYD